jgi:hypothetical protein
MLCLWTSLGSGSGSGGGGPHSSQPDILFLVFRPGVLSRAYASSLIVLSAKAASRALFTSLITRISFLDLDIVLPRCVLAGFRALIWVLVPLVLLCDPMIAKAERPSYARGNVSAAWASLHVRLYVLCVIQHISLAPPHL